MTQVTQVTQVTQEEQIEQVEQVEQITHDKLSVCPVKKTILTELITQLPDEKVTTANILGAGKSSIKLINYCTGWGVVNFPPDVGEDEELDDLCDLFDVTTVRGRRSVWVTHVVCVDDLDVHKLLDRIISVT